MLDLLVQPVSDGPHETPDLVDDGIPFISVDAIVDNKIDFDRKRGYITEEYDLECRKKYSPQRDDVYLVKSGATVGKVAIVETDERFNIWSPLAAMRTNKDLMLPKYLYFYLQLKDVQDEIYEKSIGGTQPNLSMRVLEKFDIKVPHIDEQSKIVLALENLDNLITLQQRKYYFCHLGNINNEFILKCPLFTNEWEQRKLSEITSLITKGTTPKDKSGDGEINFIKVENIDSSSGEIKDCSKISIEEHEGYLKRSQLKENDILFSIAGTLGRTTVVNKGLLPANTNQALAILRMSEGNISYIVTVLKGRAVSDFVRKNPTVGAQPNLSLEQVSNLEIPYPNIDEQAKIGGFFRDIDNLITLHQCKPHIFMKKEAFYIC